MLLIAVQVVGKCSPYARTVVTGSGLVSLLNSVRTSRVNGFALWDAVSYLPLGREPSDAAAKHMATELMKKYATSWPESARLAITVDKLLTEDVKSSDLDPSGLTSWRPALIAYALGCMGDASSGTPELVRSDAVDAIVNKLEAESVRDTLSAITALDYGERRILLAVALGQYTLARLQVIRHGRGDERFAEGAVAQPGKLAALIGCLRDVCSKGSDVVRLQPPYSSLLRSWIRPDGAVAVRLHGDKIDLDHATRKNLVFLAEAPQRRALAEKTGLMREVSRALFASLASHGIGITSSAGSVMSPATAAEFDSVPALRALKNMLSANFASGFGAEPSLSKALRRAAEAEDASWRSTASFEEVIGMQLLFAFRHFEAHVWSKPSQLVRNGLSAAVVSDAVHAVALVVADDPSGCFTFDPADRELLTTRSPRAH